MKRLLSALTARTLRTAGAGLANVVFPPTCIVCSGLVERSGLALAHVCSDCAATIDYVEQPHCPTCGHPFFGEMAGERSCPHCEGLDPEFDAGKTATLFRGPVRALVIDLKYHRGLHVLRDIEAIIERHAGFRSWIRGAVLVPVPLHPRKLRERGYNQAQLVAETFARAAGEGTTVATLLRRVVDTETQTAFDRKTRIANLKNAFALAPGAALNPALSYVLVDDVFTTGSTLNRCAHVLRAGGALNLRVATLAHG